LASILAERGPSLDGKLYLLKVAAKASTCQWYPEKEGTLKNAKKEAVTTVATVSSSPSTLAWPKLLQITNKE
jgi:hypothetical protein